VIIPDNPSDFSGDFDIGYRGKNSHSNGGRFKLEDLGNGELGFIIGAQNDSGRLLAEPFNIADTTATEQFLNPDSAPWNGLGRHSFW